MADNHDNRASIGTGRTAGTRASISHLLAMAMAMGTHPSEGPHPYRSPAHMTYGDALSDRHEWRHTVFLVEFLTNTKWKERIQVADHYPDGSEETLAEIEELIAKQHHEGREARREEIVAESDNYLGLFENVCYFDAHSHPVTSGLVQIMSQIGWAVVMHHKERCRRKRPSYQDPRIRPMIRVPTHPSYPSGHSTQVHLIKNALSEVFGFRGEKFRDELGKVAARIAENREWAGVHFKSDTVAGEKLAADIWTVASQNNSFKNLIAAAKDEAERESESLYRVLD
jgi:hypothetical protein